MKPSWNKDIDEDVEIAKRGLYRSIELDRRPMTSTATMYDKHIDSSNDEDNYQPCQQQRR